MKIRTVLLLNAIAMLLLTSAVGAITFVATRRAERITTLRVEAVELQERVLEMNILAQSHIMWHENRPVEQWYAEYEKLDRTLATPEFDEISAKIADGLRLDAKELKELFDLLNSGPGGAAPNPAAERQISGDFIVKSQSMATAADELAHLALQERISVRMKADGTIFLLLALLAVAALAAIAVIYRQIAGPILKLQKGAAIVGNGNLDHHVASAANDEIGQLSRAFDQMTARLKRSRDTLEEKIKERTAEIEDISKKSEIMLQSIGDGVIAIDKEWNITLWNPIAAKIVGCPREEALGQPFRKIVKLVRRSDRTENVLFISDVMLDGKVHIMEDDTILIRRDGTELDVADSAAPTVNDQGRITGAIIVLRDNSREKELERSKNDLISLVTHELRGPATVIGGYLQLFGEQWGKSLSAEQRDYLTKITAANDKTVELANSLMSVFRVDFGDIVVSPEPTDLAAVVDVAIGSQELSAATKKLSVTKDYDSALPILPIDKKLADLTVVNLLSNAIKYTPAGGQITVAIAKRGSEIQLSVADTGLGIPKDQQAKMFGKFFRASNVRAINGVGVGLHVIKAMLTRAGCRIWFESEEGKGSTFTVGIPLAGMIRANQ